ncbi:MAG: SpoIIE family protein phosphatase [Candidatus Acidiferrum sp.]|jgi:serine phosphatase RsbU (regulator of sigma subunit)
MLNAAALFFAQTAAATPSALRWDFANLAAAVALLTIAFAAVALFCFRRRSGDRTLIYFGLFCGLYAVRLLNFSAAFRALFDEPQSLWVYINWTITCTIIIPASLFFYQVARERAKILVRWLLVAQTVFAVFGLLGAAFGANLGTLYTANSAMVLGIMAATAVYLIAERVRYGPTERLPHEVRVLGTGFVVWMVFIVHANLLGLGILHGRNFEFVGFFVFVGCLGYVAANRTFANEQQLVAINKELEIARRIQASTLPQGVPTLAGIVIAARYAPMSAVAGDFYDFLCIDEKRVGVLVADVTGHGVPAALIASMLKVAFAGQAEHAQDPARLLAGLNMALCGKFEEHFVTAAYLFVDLEHGLLRYSAAGHPPMLLASGRDKNVRDIEENGLMLGMFPAAEYTFVEMKLNAGDRCLLYTDGVFEAKNAAQEEYGRVRCREFLLTRSGATATAFADALFEDVASFSGLHAGGAQEDDVTLIVLDIR